MAVLAGGRGVRLGGGKPGAMLGGLTLLERAVATARRWTDAPVVAVREGGTDLAGVEVMADDPALEGPLAGLASALALARRRGADHILTLPCDAPFLPGDLAARLGAAIGRGARPYRPAAGGCIPPAACGAPTSARRWPPTPRPVVGR